MSGWCSLDFETLTVPFIQSWNSDRKGLQKPNLSWAVLSYMFCPRDNIGLNPSQFLCIHKSPIDLQVLVGVCGPTLVRVPRHITKVDPFHRKKFKQSFLALQKFWASVWIEIFLNCLMDPIWDETSKYVTLELRYHLEIFSHLGSLPPKRRNFFDRNVECSQ
jgi:hypothetical protein